MISIQISDFSLSYPKRPLLSGLDLSVETGQWACLLGRSGCGKSTLLQAIAGINHGALQSGEIVLRPAASGLTPPDTTSSSASPNTSISTNTNRKVNGSVNGSVDNNTGTAKIAYMAQKDALLPWLSLLENVQFPHRLNHTRSKQTTAKARALLEDVGLCDHANKKPYEISGGQRQRVALARTLMINADIVLMDEPFSALDAITRLELQALAVKLLQDKTVFLITHDPIEAIRLADVIYVIREHSLTPAFIPEGPRPRFDPQMAQPQLQKALLEALL
ncbi:ABC transporter ATP-binding protein [Psychrobacter pygoscelis]|uniref:ABC transporter ATP-binding protein n=1 Tax=Psychrobacter pygoscelis TaxID=2488563 RepID=UPI00103EC0CB|nr:ABC transporter ATP-binding protein [Psychrobacter pygoscelis]